MTDREMLTDIDATMLAEAFACEHYQVAHRAGEVIVQSLERQQWTERFTVHVRGQTLLIPARLSFASEELRLSKDDEAWRFARALQTRSRNGFERQRAARDLLTDPAPWAAPFIVDLIGGYLVEILDDIHGALTPELEQMLGSFILENDAYWATTRSRVASYWDVYYRRGNQGRAYRRDDYVGFELTDRLEAAACTNILGSGE